MAPPKHRRPGFSRRAQYGLFAGYVIATVGVVVALALVMAWRFDPQAFALVRGTMLDVTAPFTAAGHRLARATGDAVDEVGAYWTAGARNRAMQAELAAAPRAVIAAPVSAPPGSTWITPSGMPASWHSRTASAPRAT